MNKLKVGVRYSFEYLNYQNEREILQGKYIQQTPTLITFGEVTGIRRLYQEEPREVGPTSEVYRKDRILQIWLVVNKKLPGAINRLINTFGGRKRKTRKLK
jgi:hypothetical protein